jgi:hypothetical protein
MALFWTVIALTALLNAAAAVSFGWRCAFNESTPPITAELQIDPHCTDVSFSNTDARGVFFINISVSAIILATPGVPRISVVFRNFSWGDGAMVLFDNLNVVANRDTLLTASPGVELSIEIIDCVGRNGAIVFAGSFPPHTSIKLFGINMTAVSTSAYPPILPWLAPNRGSWDKFDFITLRNVSFVDGSSLAVERSFFRIAPSRWFFLRFSGNVRIVNASRILLANLNITGIEELVYVRDSSLLFHNSSSMELHRCSLKAGQWSAVRFVESNVSISLESRILVSVSDFRAFSAPSIVSSCLVMSQTTLSIIHGSAFALVDSIFVLTSNESTFGNTPAAVRMSEVVATVSHDSKISIERCTCSALSNQATALSLDSNTMVVSDRSTLRFVDTIFSSELLTSALIGSTNLSFARGSRWDIQRCTFSSFLMNIFLGNSNVLISDNSEWTISGGSFTVVGSGVALAPARNLGVLGSVVTVASSSVWTITDVSFTCTISSSAASNWGFANGYKADFSVPYWTVVIVDDMSVWRTIRCSFTNDAWTSSQGLISFSPATVTVTNGSEWIFEDCVGSSSTGIGGAIALQSAVIFYPTVRTITTVVAVRNNSGFRVLRCSFAALRAPALVVTGTSLLVSHFSVWIVEGSMLSGSSVALSFTSPVIFTDSSAFLLTGVVFSGAVVMASGVTVEEGSVMQLNRSEIVIDSAQSVPISSSVGDGDVRTCVEMGLLRAGHGSGVRVLENKCLHSAPLSDLRTVVVFYALVALAAAGGPFPSVVDRCNTVNGAVVVAVPPVPEAAISLPCGACHTPVDCFWPLTEPSNFTKMACGSACPCIENSCLTLDSACFPVTPSGPSSSVCRANKDFNVRLRITTTHSATPSAFTSLSASATVHHQETAQIRSPTAAYVSAVSVGLSVFIYGSSGAAALQRMQAQQRINNCGSESSGDDGEGIDFASSPTQLKIPDDSSRSSSLVRGAVVGNVALWAACAAVAIFLAKLLQQRNVTESLRTSCAELGLPGLLSVPYSILMIPTVEASATLLASSSAASVANVLIGLLGILLCFFIAALFAYVTVFRVAANSVARMSQAHIQVVEKSSATRSDPHWSLAQSLAGLKLLFVTHFSNMWEWSDRRGSSGFTAMWGELFEAFVPHRQWFMSVESTSDCITAVLAGLAATVDASSSEAESGCSKLAVLSAVISIALLISLLLLRPYGASGERRVVSVNAAVTAVASVLTAARIETQMLTALQALLNLLAAFVFVLGLVAEGRFATLWTRSLRVAVCVRDARRLRRQRQQQSARHRDGQLVVPSDLLLSVMMAHDGGSADWVRDRLLVLEHLVRFICESPRDEQPL